MKKFEFKNFKGYFFVEKYNKGEEKSRAKIYDENMQYLDYIDTETITQKEYNSELELLQNMENEESFFDYFCQSYVFGNTPQEILQMYWDDITFGNGVAETEKERKGIATSIENMINEKLCKEYDINKIGNMYFKRNW